MAKGARFGLDFANEQLAKRKKWKKQGKKAGHGGAFDIDSPLAALTKASSAVAPPPEAPSLPKAGGSPLIQGSEIPQWMLRAMETDSEVAFAATHKKVTEEQVSSPHKRRIGQGIKSEKERDNKQLKEHWLQVRIFFTLEVKYPSLYEVAFAVPNGGARAARTASLMMYEGQKKGTPDICIPEPRGRYHGMFLEVKTEKGTASKEQKAKLELYRKRGYYVAVGKGFAQCHAEIDKYHNLPEFDNCTALAA